MAGLQLELDVAVEHPDGSIQAARRKIQSIAQRSSFLGTGVMKTARHQRGFWRTYIGVALWKRLVVAALLGIVAGLIFDEHVAWMKGLGDAFILLMQMLIIPLIVTVMITAVSGLDSPGTLGRMGGVTLVLFLSTSAIAILIGITVAQTFDLGHGVELTLSSDFQPAELPTLGEQLSNFVPVNVFASLADGEILQIIIFALIFGAAITVLGEQASTVRKFFKESAAAVMVLIGLVIEFAPIGVFGIVAWMVGTIGLDGFLPLLQLALIVHVVIIVHMLLVQGSLVKVLGGRSPVQFFKAMLSPMLFGYTSTSSSATLPLTLRSVKGPLQVPASIADFVVPLGAVINMNGSAIYHTMMAMFIANAVGATFGFVDYLTVVFVVLAGAISASTVPGAGIVTMTFVFSSLGLPLEAIGLLLVVDRLLDPPRAMVNVVGDAMVSVILARHSSRLGISEANSNAVDGDRNVVVQ